MKLSDEELNKIMMKADDDLDRLKDRCHELHEENQKLKELCDKYEEEHNTIFKEWQQDIQANKKAIEYNNQIIKDTKDFYRPTTDIIYSGDALIEIATNNINILQNGSDSQ